MEDFASLFENKIKKLASSNKGLLGFTQIPNRFIKREDLNPYEKMIVIVIKMHMMNKNHSWPSHKTIAREVGCSTTTVKKSLKNLVAQKIIIKEYWDTTRSNKYEIRM
jgi:hypothetical protein